MTILIILLALNALVGGYFLISRLAAPQAADASEPVLVMCGSCGNIYKSADSGYPLVCPQCGKQEVYAAFKCEECGKTFNQQDAIADSDSAKLECPYCHSEKVHPLLAEPAK